MKTEHKAIIDRAKLLDTPPSVLAHELLVHDLVNAGLFELKNLHSPYSKLNEGQQQEVIDRLSEAATEAVCITPLRSSAHAMSQPSKSP